ncbi:MAG: hypothetical protein H6Q48_3550, partial [Deltaproteobacteria bacterium]|nr:hypothetical protein [Deltaproteobacteria bacterium]
MPLAFISSRAFAEATGVTPLAQILHQDDLAFGQPPHEAIELLFSGLDFTGFRLVGHGYPHLNGEDALQDRAINDPIT